jgi:hypothetical protein
MADEVRPGRSPLGDGDRAVSDSPVTTGDLTRFAATISDLADPDVMSQAWQ